LPPASLSANVIVPDNTASLNVAETLPPNQANVAPEAGFDAAMVGGVVSGTPVVKDHVNGLIVCPEESCAPLIVAVYVVVGASAADGVSDAVKVAES
jgi:hypothetical protein